MTVPGTKCPDSTWTNLGLTCTRAAACPGGTVNILGICTGPATVVTCPAALPTFNGLDCVGDIACTSDEFDAPNVFGICESNQALRGIGSQSTI